jgi:hypothetical protein
MPDYISLIGLMGLLFVPLYIPIAVTIIGGIRRGREAVGATRPAVDPTGVLTSPDLDRASAHGRVTPAAVARGIDGVLPNTARPIVEPV